MIGQTTLQITRKAGSLEENIKSSGAPQDFCTALYVGGTIIGTKLS